MLSSRNNAIVCALALFVGDNVGMGFMVHSPQQRPALFSHDARRRSRTSRRPWVVAPSSSSSTLESFRDDLEKDSQTGPNNAVSSGKLRHDKDNEDEAGSGDDIYLPVGSRVMAESDVVREALQLAIWGAKQETKQRPSITGRRKKTLRGGNDTKLSLTEQKTETLWEALSRRVVPPSNPGRLVPASLHASHHDHTNNEEAIFVKKDDGIYYRMGTVRHGQFKEDPDCMDRPPQPYKYKDPSKMENSHLLIDNNGFAWRNAPELRSEQIDRYYMNAPTVPNEASLSISNHVSELGSMPVPWTGPLDLVHKESVPVVTQSGDKIIYRYPGPKSEATFRLHINETGSVPYFEADDERWLVYYSRLCHFYATYGHCDVPSSWPQDRALGQWVSRQRKLYNAYVRNDYYQHQRFPDGTWGNKIISLSPWRIQTLYDLGFIFRGRIVWEDRFVQLLRYRSRYGNCHVPSPNRSNNDTLTNVTSNHVAKKDTQSQEEEYPGLHQWCSEQRTMYRRTLNGAKCTDLANAKLQLLHRINFFEWDPTQAAWDERIQQLQAFHATYRHSNVNKHEEGNEELGRWLIYIRTQYRLYQGETPWESSLIPERIQQLNDLNVDWNPIDSQWEDKYQMLKSFFDQYGHCRVPIHNPENPTLGLWVGTQRDEYRAGTLKEDRKVRLDDLNFTYNMYEDAFERGLERLRAYKEVHGHCGVPTNYEEDPALWSFVDKNRQTHALWKQGKASSMNHEKIQILNELGFIWNARETTWEENFDRLEAFCLKYGHCNVPPTFKQNQGGASLYNFVANQRADLKADCITKDRKERLDAIGFVWNIREEQWMQCYQELAKYRKECGNCNVPAKYEKNSSLGKWVKNQRSRKTSMKPHRRKLLDQLDFEWTMKSRTMKGIVESPDKSVS